MRREGSGTSAELHNGITAQSRVPPLTSHIYDTKADLDCKYP